MDLKKIQVLEEQLKKYMRVETYQKIENFLKEQECEMSIEEFVNKALKTVPETLYEMLKKDIYIPCWVIEDFYNITKMEWNKLIYSGKIKEIPKKEEYYSKKEVFNVITYPIEILEHYTQEELQKELEQLHNYYNVEIKAKTEDKIKDIEKELENCFQIKINEEIKSYNDNEYYYSNLQVQSIKDNLGKNKYLAKIQMLQKEKKELENKISKIKEKRISKSYLSSVFRINEKEIDVSILPKLKENLQQEIQQENSRKKG